MVKPTLYAKHSDGRKLYLPQWDADGEIIDTGLPTAAVTIDLTTGETFPKGSVWIHKPQSWELQAGWSFPGGETKRPRIRRTKRPCEVCGTKFLAKRQDARICSDRCRNKASYRNGRRGNPNVAIDTDNQRSPSDATENKELTEANFEALGRSGEIATVAHT